MAVFSFLKSSASCFEGFFVLVLIGYSDAFIWAEEGQDEYEKDGFIVDDVEEEEEEDEEDRADSDDERQKKKKRKKR